MKKEEWKSETNYSSPDGEPTTSRKKRLFCSLFSFSFLFLSLYYYYYYSAVNAVGT